MMAFCGWNPKLLWSERASPRTATSEEVMSTAQMAICAIRSRSRMVKRRIVESLMPVRMVCQGSARSTWRTGTMPKSSPLASAIASATR